MANVKNIIVGAADLWIISLWRLLKNNIRTIYFNSKQYNQSLKATPASRNYDIHNVHILGELQDKNTKNYILAKQFKKKSLEN